MDTRGRHLLVEYGGCCEQMLNSRSEIEQLMRDAAEASGATIVTSTFHQFAPQGVSGVVVVEESHLSIHTWPERGYAAVDFYTCGDCAPEAAHQLLLEGLGATEHELIQVERGVGPIGRAMKITEHSTDVAPVRVKHLFG
jgi:S-adenosylmethionine decarboxylase proenzyme